jgi:hypothetical protein
MSILSDNNSKKDTSELLELDICDAILDLKK